MTQHGHSWGDPWGAIRRAIRARGAAIPTARVVGWLPTLCGALLLAAIAGAASLSIAEDAQVERLSRANEFEVELTHFVSAIRDAENEQRGYLLTGDEIFLAEYDASIAESLRAFSALEVLAPSVVGSGSIADLRALGSRRLTNLEQILALARSGRRDGAVAVLRAGAGRALMNDLRTRVAELEVRQRAELTAIATRVRQTTLAIVLAGFLVVAVTVLIVGLWWRDRGAAADQRSFSNAAGRAAAKNLQASRDNTTVQTEGREAAEDQVRQLQKMESLGQLTGGVAHDFNNMLAVIISAIAISKRRIAAGNLDIDAMLDAATDGATRAAGLTARLLAFSRQQPLSPQGVDINAFIAGMIDLLGRTLGEGIRLEKKNGNVTGLAHVDVSQLENAILNLAVNARDAMQERGTLTLEARNATLDENYVRNHADAHAGEFVMIAVTDTGEGMAPDVVKRAFEPFYTTKPVGSGTGLGLSQVFGFVKQSGGSVSIDSEVGRGTTIKLFLPRYYGAVDERGVAGAGNEVLDVGDFCGVILVVDDERRLREVTAAGLRELGYTVIHTGSGADALRILSENHDIGCLFTDIMMPNMNGRELARKAHLQHPSLRILFTTGYAIGEATPETLGFVEHVLLKPYTLEAMGRKVRQVLGAPVPYGL